MKNLMITVVIPAKNEAVTIGEIIKGAQKYANEVLVVDGNSSDDTAKVSQELGAKVVKDSGTGKGKAIRLAINEAKGDIIVFIDADGSHDTEDIPKLILPIIEDKFDMVIASRGKGGSDELHGDIDKCFRLVGSEIITLAINWRFKQRLTDTQNGFRAIKKEAAMTLGLKENITTIEQEMVMKALKKGYRIGEVPGHEYERKHGNSSIVLRRVWFRYVYCLLKGLF